jgi:hypothetical protein
VQETCGLSSCNRPAKSSKVPVCSVHWRRVPDDIRERIRWAMDEGGFALDAALSAADDFLSP